MTNTISLLAQAKPSLQTLEAKINSVTPVELQRKSQQVQDDFVRCKAKCNFLKHELENRELTEILDKLQGNEVGFRAGIQELNNIIQKLNGGIAILDIVDQTVAVLFRISGILA